MSASQVNKIPDVSFIVPCFNEEEILGYTVPRLHAAFENAGYDPQLVVVDNGSGDNTGAMIKQLAAQYASIVPYRVEVNQGYGFGVTSAIPLCEAPWIGIIPADGQVDAEDVVRLYEAVITTDGNVLGKVRRRFRMDGLYRKLVSTSYNLFVRTLYPTMRSIDINGSPKLLPARAMRAMNLESRGWLLDPEIMIKAHYMGMRVMELNVFARMRGNGVSHVKAMTCWEFLMQLLKFRFSLAWRRKFESAGKNRAAVDSPGHAVRQVSAGRGSR